MVKPPLGVVPQKIWKEIRLAELYAAVQRYIDAQMVEHPNVNLWMAEAECLEKQMIVMAHGENK